ncbi:MAG: AsmA-like C-terminal domain-containing protein [Campylobacter sp.]|nr:AsmA-like C-terminal domain-containing protein [Campylobacter sp.]
MSSFFRFFYKFFIALALLFVVLVLLLKHGVEFENLHFSGANLDKFFIKLDENIILKIENLTIPKSQKQDKKEEKNLAQIQQSLVNQSKKIITLGKFFQEIDIKNINLGDQNITLFYKNDTFYIDNQELRVNTKITELDDGEVKFFLNDFELKNFNLYLGGELTTDTKHNKYKFDGVFSSHELDGKFEFDIVGDMLNYEIYDVHALSLKNFMDEFAKITDLHPEVKSWIYGKIVAQEYTIENLRGKLNLRSGDFFPNDLTGSAFAKNLKIKFEESIEPADVDEAHISLNNGDLSFYLKNPYFKGKNMFGSSVSIRRIFSDNPSLLLDLQTDGVLDTDLVAILGAYGINLPLYQTNGKTDSRVILDVDLINLGVKVGGFVRLEDADIIISDAPFKSKKANLTLGEEKMILKDSNLKSDIFDLSGDGEFDLINLKADFNAIINSLNINFSGKKILNLKNAKDRLRLDFKDIPILSSQFLNTDIKFDKTTTISVKKFENLVQFSPFLKNLGIKGGDLKISTKDFSNFDILGENLKFDFGILHKNGKAYNSDNLKLKITPNSVSGESESKILSFKMDKNENLINIHNADFIVNFGDSGIKIAENLNDKINFNGQNSNLILKDLNKTLNFTSYKGVLNGVDTEIDAKFEKGDIKLKLKKHLFQALANDIESKTINSLLGSQSFDGGVFSLKASGIDPSEFKGEIEVKNTFLKDYVLYQQLLSFLNSIPSLLSFKTPDFNDKGFTVKNGKAYFRRSGEKIIIEAMDFVGTSADIAGSGEINLKNKNINIDLEIKYLKDASSFISKIPLLNHIILGKDGTISTIVEIRGTLDKPTYKTGVAKDLISTPFNIIKNTLTLPFVIFERDKK